MIESAIEGFDSFEGLRLRCAECGESEGFAYGENAYMVAETEQEALEHVRYQEGRLIDGRAICAGCIEQLEADD